MELDRNFLFLGSKFGNIRFYDFEDHHENKNINLIQRSEIKINNKITNLKFRNSKCSLIAALGNGSVAFWAHDPAVPEFILEAHSKSVNKLIFIEETGVLFTCSSDKSIKVI